MLTRRALFPTIAAPLALSRRPVAAAGDAGLTVGDDGLHKQDWFLDSFLELGDDLATAAEEGRGLVVLFEQAGCPYCRELHRVNFAKPEIVEEMTANFDTVQLDLWGSRAVLDFDGEEVEERGLAQKWGVNFTPTLAIFHPSAAAAETPKEAFRVPGYFKPFHFIAALRYVASGAYAEQPFQRHLQDVFADLKAKGIEPEVW